MPHSSSIPATYFVVSNSSKLSSGRSCMYRRQRTRSASVSSSTRSDQSTFESVSPGRPLLKSADESLVQEIFWTRLRPALLLVSASLFAVYGVVSCGVGLMLLFVVNADQRPVGFGMFHPRPDARVFGNPTISDEMQGPLAVLRAMHWHWLGGVLVSFGLLQLGVIWFGLLNRQVWALILLALADLAM